MVLFSVGVLTAAPTHPFALLVTARVVQARGAAVMTPVLMATVAAMVPPAPATRTGSNGFYSEHPVERLYEFPDGHSREPRWSVTFRQSAHVLEGLRRRQRRQSPAQGPRSGLASVRCGDSAYHVMQIVHCGAYRQTPDAGSVIRLPLPRCRGNDTDPVQSSVDAVDQIRSIADQREPRVARAYELLGLPGDDPDQLVLLHMNHGRTHRTRIRGPPLLIVALQLFRNSLNRGFSLDHDAASRTGPRPDQPIPAAQDRGEEGRQGSLIDFRNTTAVERALRTRTAAHPDNVASGS
ncbi:hypothetical protein GCM10010358_61340 [Streptomyces minutiscleroticus]|uniref:Uncharacterized protein n=1 Tax=Streptomyces minutiscleroticus TaxID=68238 RepID=A0A918NVY3_9ACTN|nr:hypothetical protein GCM10010358_61340 [Streptomyces minutiscleroticus]